MELCNTCGKPAQYVFNGQFCGELEFCSECLCHSFIEEVSSLDQCEAVYTLDVHDRETELLYRSIYGVPESLADTIAKKIVTNEFAYVLITDSFGKRIDFIF